MTENIEQPECRDQWTILHNNALEELQEKVNLLRAECEHLEAAVTRTAAECVLITPLIPRPIEPSEPISARTTLLDGTDIISVVRTDETKLVASESDKLRELKSALELTKGKKLYVEDELAHLQKMESADITIKQAWIRTTVDNFFQKVLADYTAYTAQKAEDTERKKDPQAKVHKHTLTNNAIPSLLALALYPELSTDPNRDQVLATFIAENKAEFTIAKYKVAEMMLDQARQLGLLPNNAEAIDQQDRKLATVLQKLNT